MWLLYIWSGLDFWNRGNRMRLLKFLLKYWGANKVTFYISNTRGRQGRDRAYYLLVKLQIVTIFEEMYASFLTIAKIFFSQSRYWARMLRTRIEKWFFVQQYVQKTMGSVLYILLKIVLCSIESTFWKKSFKKHKILS